MLTGYFFMNLTSKGLRQSTTRSKNWKKLHASIRKARGLCESLFNAWDDALLFRTLATLRLDVPVFDTVEDLRWMGPRPKFEEYCLRMKSPGLLARALSAKSGHSSMSSSA
jgi:hypothetical protein